MGFNELSKEIKDRIANLSDEELLHMVNVEFADYRPEAVEYARALLAERGIDASQAADEEETDDWADDGTEAVAAGGALTESEAELSPRTSKDRSLACPACGGATRPGMLFEGSAQTIIFTDTTEQRFVDVLACSKCGLIQLVVDFEDEV